MILSNEKRKLITRGIGCPRQDVKFVVEINSDILGKAIYDFYVPVPNRDKDYDDLSYSDSNRFSDGLESYSDDQLPLNVRETKMTGNGILTIVFNKPIFQLQINEKEQDQSQERLLRSQ